MVITGEYVVKGLSAVKGGLFHPINHIFFFLCTIHPSLLRVDVSKRGCSMIIQIHGFTKSPKIHMKYKTDQMKSSSP